MNEFGNLIEPPPVPFRFGAPGWYVAGGFLLLALFVIVWLWVKHNRRNAYRRDALRWLQQQETLLKDGRNLATYVYETNMLLKRIAMARYNRARVASLRGNEWLLLLNNSMKRPLFTAADSQLLQQAVYEQKNDLQPTAAAGFKAKSKTWIQHHRYHYAV